MLEPYAPAGVEKLDSKFVDGDNPPAWLEWMHGLLQWLQYCRGWKAGLTPPTSWKDLTDPQYAGHLIMPSPNSSGTGFLDVSSWVFGEEGGWNYGRPSRKYTLYTLRFKAM